MVFGRLLGGWRARLGREGNELCVQGLINAFYGVLVGIRDIPLACKIICHFIMLLTALVYNIRSAAPKTEQSHGELCVYPCFKVIPI